MIHNLLREILQYATKSFKICIYFDLAISLLRIYLKDIVIPRAKLGTLSGFCFKQTEKTYMR